ncbi:MAG: hypothetical protein ACR2P4_05460 [Gammaproteobacteria bacterium]
MTTPDYNRPARQKTKPRHPPKAGFYAAVSVFAAAGDVVNIVNVVFDGGAGYNCRFFAPGS